MELTSIAGFAAGLLMFDEARAVGIIVEELFARQLAR